MPEDLEGPRERRGGGRRRKAGGGKRHLKRQQTHRKQNLVGALNHKLRRQMLRLLVRSSEPLSPVKVSRQLGVPLSNVSYHMDILRKSDAAAVVEERQVRGAMEHFYVSNIADSPGVQTMLDETEIEDEGDGRG